MILSFRDKKTEAVARGDFIKAFSGFETQAERRLAILKETAMFKRAVYPGAILKDQLDELGVTLTEFTPPDRRAA